MGAEDDRDVAGRASCRVLAPARLHLGFLDLAGDLGRRFGSVGLALDGIATVLSVRAAEADRITGPDAGRAAAHLAHLREAWGIATRLCVTIEQAIPPHAGLGSGTQLGLALGLALARLHGIETTPRAIAERLDRGARSGIGLAAFTVGGFLVDGGKGPEETAAPPVIARLPFPDAWRVLLLLDPAHQGVHGAAEAAAFLALPPFPAGHAAALCRLVLMRLLPAIARAELAPVASALAEIQRTVGDHFAPFQGGGRFASPAVAEALAWLEVQGVTGLGQSSWGPTGWALLPDARAAERVAREARQRFSARGLAVRVVSGRNQPGEIHEAAAIRKA